MKLFYILSSREPGKKLVVDLCIFCGLVEEQNLYVAFYERFKKFVKMTDHTCSCNDLTNF